MAVSISALFPRLRLNSSGYDPVQAGHAITDIAVEAEFMQALRRERRRTERSGRAFMLALISGDALSDRQRPRLANELASAVASCVRETDTVGWYRSQLSNNPAGTATSLFTEYCTLSSNIPTI